jgi:proline racemase
MKRITTLDAHVAGQPVRLIVNGVSAVSGDTMSEKLKTAALEVDWARYVVIEPRGHRDLVGALLTEPCSPDAHAGVLFLDSAGWSSVAGTGLMGVAALAVGRGLIGTGRSDGAVRLDTAGGMIEAIVHDMDVRIVPPPCSVVAGGLSLPPLPAPAGYAPTSPRSAPALRIDLVQAGDSRFIVADAEAAGVPLHIRHVDKLRAGAARILHAWYRLSRERPHAPRVSPFDTDLDMSSDAVIFTAPAHDGADLRAVPVDAAAQVDRSATLSGVAAIVAVLDAMELVPEDRPILVEGLSGLTLAASVVRREHVDGRTQVWSEVSGTVWITGEHTFIVDPRDPLPGPEPE